MIRILHEVAHSDNTWDHHYYISTGRSEGMFTIRHRYQERIWTSRFGPENKNRDYHVFTLANDPVKAKTKAEQWAQENKVELENMEEFDTALRRIKRGEGGIFPSGKYSGKTAQEVYEQDPGYLEWAYRANAFKSQVTLWKNIVALVGEEIESETAEYKAQAQDMLDRLKAAGSPFVYDLDTLDYTYDNETFQNKLENDLANLSYSVFLDYTQLIRGNGSKANFDSALRKAESMLARVAQNQASEYQGQIGDTIEITGTLKFKSQSMQNRFGGWMRIYSIQTNNGVVVYKGDNAYFNALESGASVHFQATVKAHDEYQGTKQTVVTRIKPLS